MATITKKDAMQFLAKVPGDKVFRCNDSCIMGDMKGLAQALSTMADPTFAFHANETKNDFATWVADVMGDRELAASLRKINDRMRAAKVVADRAAFLSRRA